MVSALTFIDKGLPYEERDIKFLNNVYFNMKQEISILFRRMTLSVENGNATVRVPFREVEYVMTDEPHRLALVTLGANRLFYGTLKEIEIIDERLFRCHQSYIVNTEANVFL